MMIFKMFKETLQFVVELRHAQIMTKRVSE